MPVVVQVLLLRTERLSKVFSATSQAGAVHAIQDVSFVVNRREVVGIVGPSGAGKTTLLRLLMGLEVPTTGTIAWASAQMPGELRISVCFQRPALLPWFSALANAVAGLRFASQATPSTCNLARTLLGDFELGVAIDRLPGALSLGMQQRVALARALAVSASCYLFDEPVSAVDMLLRGNVLRAVRSEVLGRGAGAVLVSHSLEDVCRVCDRILVLAGYPARIVEEVQSDPNDGAGSRAARLDAAQRVLGALLRETRNGL